MVLRRIRGVYREVDCWVNERNPCREDDSGKYERSCGRRGGATEEFVKKPWCDPWSVERSRDAYRRG